MDDTAWPIDGSSGWPWAAITDESTAKNVADASGFRQATDLVGVDYRRVITREGWYRYRNYEQGTYQSTVAHLLRPGSEMISDPPGWARAVPRQVK
jgi:hypothetical protein